MPLERKACKNDWGVLSRKAGPVGESSSLKATKDALGV